MRLFGKWRILVEGDEDSLKALPLRTQGRDYLLNRLFAGEPIEEKGLEHYGIRVRELTENEEVITVPPDASNLQTLPASVEQESQLKGSLAPGWHRGRRSPTDAPTERKARTFEAERGGTIGSEPQGSGNA